MFAAPVVLAPMPVPVLGAMGVGPGVRTPATVSTGVGVADDAAILPLLRELILDLELAL